MVKLVYTETIKFMIAVILGIEKHMENPRVLSAGLQRLRASEPSTQKGEKKDMGRTRTNTIYHTINRAV